MKFVSIKITNGKVSPMNKNTFPWQSVLKHV